MIRVTPKISDSPAATRNSDDAVARPFRNWMMMLAKVTSGMLGARHSSGPIFLAADMTRDWSRAPPADQLAGLIFFTSASDGSASLPSTKRHSFM